MPDKNELVASLHPIEEVSEFSDVDSLEYITMDDLKSVEGDPDSFCLACFNRDY